MAERTERALDILAAHSEYKPEEVEQVREAYRRFRTAVDDIWKDDPSTLDEHRSRVQKVHQLRDALTARETRIFGDPSREREFEAQLTRLSNQIGSGTVGTTPAESKEAPPADSTSAKGASQNEDNDSRITINAQ